MNEFESMSPEQRRMFVKEFNNLPVIKKQNDIYALGWKQPYAQLMLHGKIETRTWAMKPERLPRRVLIYATKKPYRYFEIVGIGKAKAVLTFIDNMPKVNKRPINIDKLIELNFKHGVAIAIGTIVECRPMLPEDEEKCFVRYHSGLYCHVYKDVQAIEPFPFKGSQGWRKLTEEEKNKIKVI